MSSSNQSACIAPAAVDVCSKHGHCELSKGTYRCNCALFYEQASFCERDFFKIWAGSDIFYPILGLFFNFIFVVFIVLEIIIDLRRIRLIGQKAAFVTKILFFCYSVLRFCHFSVWLARTVNNDVTTITHLAESIVSSAGVVFALLTMSGVAIFWCELARRIETLGRQAKHEIDILRKVFLIAVCIAAPASVITYTLSNLGTTHAYTFNLIYNVVVGLYLLAVSITQGIFSLRNLATFKKLRASQEALRLKNNALLALDVNTTVIVIVLLAFPFTGFRGIATPYLAYQSIVRLLEVIQGSLIFVAINSYMFSPMGFCKAYWAGLSTCDPLTNDNFKSQKSTTKRTATSPTSSSKTLDKTIDGE